MNYFKIFLKEWGGFFLILALIGLSRVFLWSNVRVEGHSMDPTLADNEILFVVKHLPIDRYDIVVAHEDAENKDIVNGKPLVLRFRNFDYNNPDMNVDYEKEASKEEKIITETLKKNFPEEYQKKWSHLISTLKKRFEEYKKNEQNIKDK